jgi:D-alanyl-lipoteichoic acid acyltransferase DltB (MBOAT superfamily)
MPIGISFFTFQALSYSIDVYRNKIRVSDSLLDFACFVSFFPQLIAGPIVRGQEFLPQIPNHHPLRKENTIKGVELILIGYFKKCIIADNISPISDGIFNYSGMSSTGGLLIWFGVFCFSVQIYCDFSGYSDIARGLGRIAGFHIPVNFRWPYLSQSIQEFWRRWHITLSYWIRDYVYISLGGSRGTVARYLINVIITWLLCGLWHGAASNFVLWGGYHGLLVGGAHLMRNTIFGKFWQILPKLFQMSFVFVLILIGWALFRSPNLLAAKVVLVKMFLPTHNYFTGWQYVLMPLVMLLISGLFHMLCYKYNYDIDTNSLLIKIPWYLRPVVVALVIFVIVIFAGEQEAFIYFAF